MPRSVAMMLGLMLAAFSIGYNTVHYPVVWEMVGPGQTRPTEQPAVASQSEKDEPLAPTAHPEPAPAHPATPIAVQPAPVATDKVVADKPAPVETKPANGNNPPAAAIDARKPLVPITLVSSPNASGSIMASGAGIRRLPPVGTTATNPTICDAAPSGSASIPFYPTTGIE
jgi:hypothetical protein